MKTMYYIALLPPEAIRQEIKDLKTDILNRFGSGYALRSPAHITLQMPFHFEAEEEPQLIEALERFTRNRTGFTCDLHGFGHFEKRTLFVEVVPNDHLANLRSDLQKLLGDEFGFGPKQLPERFHPHITIANRDLSEDNFEPCWALFRNRIYQRSFVAKHIAILKHRGDHWEVYREFPFTDA